jgi:hypothetical protein
MIQKTIRVWNRFWFETDGRAQMRLFRIGLALLLLGCYAIRSLDLELFYGEHGLMPASLLTELMPMSYRFSIFRVFTGEAALWIGNGVLLAGLAALAAGFKPRLASVVVWLVHLSFVHRNLAIAYGVDTIACFFLFYMLFADHRDDKDYRPGDLQAILGSMAYRLCQIQVCIIYGYSGIKKLKGFAWWNGDAVWHSLAQVQLAGADFSWMAHFPLALAGVTYLTLAWEIYFPALIWIKPIRVPLLIVGVLLHMGIAFGMSLPLFGALMVLTYVLFLDPKAFAPARRIFATRA